MYQRVFQCCPSGVLHLHLSPRAGGSSFQPPAGPHIVPSPPSLVASASVGPESTEQDFSIT